jgi:hypothetical protein
MIASVFPCSLSHSWRAIHRRARRTCSPAWLAPRDSQPAPLIRAASDRAFSYFLIFPKIRTFRTCPDRDLVPLAGIEPALLAELDFESSASTNSTTGARFRGGRIIVRTPRGSTSQGGGLPIICEPSRLLLAGASGVRSARQAIDEYRRAELEKSRRCMILRPRPSGRQARSLAERWQSGRMRRTRNAKYGQPYRGFESLPLRHFPEN